MSSLVDTHYYTVIPVTTTMLHFTLHITQDFHSHPALFVFWSAGTSYRLAEFSYQLPSNPANQAAGCCTSWTSTRHIKGNKNLTPGCTASANPLVFPGCGLGLAGDFGAKDFELQRVDLAGALPAQRLHGMKVHLLPQVGGGDK